MPTTTAIDFWEAVDKSELFSPSTRLQVQTLAEAIGPSAAPDALAERLLEERFVTRFQAKQLLAGRYRGFFVAGKYKILELLGEGGMGRVLLCEHLLMRRLVALKLMHARFQKRPGATDRFLREARAAAALNHPNIVQVFDVDQSERGPYIVMEYVDGIDLHRLTARHGPLEVARAAHYIRQAALGLQHAHEAGLVHRDIKPVNMMLDRNGTVKLLDLGLARFFEADTNDKLTQQHDMTAIIGTADFIAPEQILDSSTADIRADIYSLGMSLYFMLARKVPFVGGKAIQKLLWHQVREPEPLSAVRDDVPPEFVAVLDKMIKKNPDQRYQTPAEAAAALAPFVGDVVPLPTADEMPQVSPATFRLGLSAAKPRSASSGAAPSSGVVSAAVRTHAQTESRGPGDTDSRSRIDDGPAGSQIPASGLNAAVTPQAATSQIDDWLAAELPLTQQPALNRLSSPTLPLPKPTAANPQRNLWLWTGGLGGAIVVVWLGWLISTLSLPPQATEVNGSTALPAVAAEVPSSPAPVAAAPVSDVVLHGGGSTFVRPMLEHWAELYFKKSGVRVNYAGVGSSKGVQGLTSRLLDFACSDAYLTDAQLQESGGPVVHVPLVLGAVVPTYNLPLEAGADALRFTGPILANIYLGKITKWNDPAIAVSNPGLKLPDLPITVVYRKDGSGTTSIWTDYLSKTGSQWKDAVGTGTLVKWPVGVGAEKNDGVADLVNRTSGAIGYVELSYALTNGLPCGQVKNAAGAFVAPSIAGVTAAAGASAHAIPDDMRYSLTDAPGTASYPIVGTAWALIYVDQPSVKAEELANFFRWATTDGQAYAGDLMYGRLPPEMTQRIGKSLDRLRGKR
jgi:phosphate ABC transporter phosphate-binding protein